MLKKDIPLFIHTVNDIEDQKRYITNGISGIYTDITNKEDLYY